MRLRVVEYAIVGSTPVQLRAAIAALGPSRGGHVFGAFTDWELVWRNGTHVEGGMTRACNAEVELFATITLPRWRPPRTASSATIDAFRRYYAALVIHEHEHVDLARAATIELRDRLESVPACAGPVLVRQAARLAAQEVISALRQRDEAYDERTAHGARQGVTLDGP